MKTLETLKNIKAKQYKIRFGITWYFTIIVSIEILATVAVSAAVTYVFENVFGWQFDFSSSVWLIICSLFIGFATSVVANRIMLAPIRKLNKAMKQVAKGDFHIALEPNSRINEIKDIYESFNMMTRELNATEILQTDFVSNVSHEIKTPVNAIEGYAMLLQDSSSSDDEKKQYTDKILFNTKRLSELVSNILLLSRLDNQTFDTKKKAFRLDEQIRQSVLLLEPKWAEKNIEFDVDMESVIYNRNEALLQHVWDNLISNAIKFGPCNGLIKIKLIKQQCEQVRKMLVFTIEDEGNGIEEKDICHIFGKFYQADSSHKQEGNGLGLALCKKIVDISGGEIFAENMKEGGCRFTVKLPM